MVKLDIDPKIVSQRMKERRKALGNITQVELSERSGVSLNSIKSYESGRRVPDTTNLSCLSKALETTSGYLTGKPNIFDKWNEEIDLDTIQKELFILEYYENLGCDLSIFDESGLKSFIDLCEKSVKQIYENIKKGE